MPDVIELRVHGVGGSPPEGLLGVARPEDCVQEAGEGETAFVSRRADRRVQGYIWGALTQKPLLQPLWLFLLPYTLVNVSGWMHRPVEELRRGWHGWLRIFRGLVLLIGAAFTASYFVWLSNVVINRLYHGQTRLHFAWGPRTRVALGGAAVTLLLGVVYLLAHTRQTRFEGVKPPAGVTSGSSSSGELRLSDPRFWNRPGYARRLLLVHVLVGLAAVAGVTAWSWVHSSPSDVIRNGVSAQRALGIASLATYTTEFALWAIVALTVVDRVGWRRPPAGALRFRWLGPTTAATAGVAYGTMFLYALPLLFGAHSGGRVAIMATSFGIGTLAAIAAGAGVGVWYVRRKRRELSQARSGPPPFGVPPNPEDRAGDEPQGATPGMYGRIAGSRTLSEAGRSGTVALTASSVVFLVFALFQFRFGQIHWLSWSVRVGEVIAAGGTGALLAFLIRNARRPNERRVVGIIWDVMTFWPRRFHPFAVRPYAERAVPELEARIMRLVGAYERRVVLSCHSQGTVLGYAALVQLPDEVVREVAFVTYGTPLRQLYEMAFPAYFSRQDFDALRGRLFHDGRSPPACWRIFYRLTDYIGKSVFQDPAFEEVVPDPAVGPLACDAPLDRPLDAAFPDTPRNAWSELFLHSYYNREDQLKAWLRDLKRRMALPQEPREPAS